MPNQTSHSPRLAPPSDDSDSWIDTLLIARPTTTTTTAPTTSQASPTTAASPLAAHVVTVSMQRSGASPAARAPEQTRARPADGPALRGLHSSLADTAPPPAVMYQDDEEEDNSGGGVVREGVAKVARLSPWVLLRVVILCACVLGGQATQIIMLNFWLRQFPSSSADGDGDGVAGNYTILAVSGLIFFFFFLMIFAVYVVLRRPDLRFMREPHAWGLLMRAAAMDTLTSALAIYAASHTSEVLQALFISMVPLYASVFTKLFLKDHRQYCNSWVLMSFACIVAGVFVATSANFASHHEQGGNASSLISSGSGSDDGTSSRTSSGEDSLSDRRWWALLFCAAIPIQVLMDIFQTLFMLRYTYDPDFFAYVARLVVAEGESWSAQRPPPPHAHRRGNYRGDDDPADQDESVAVLLPFDEDDEVGDGTDPWRQRASYSYSNSRLSGAYRYPTSVTRLMPLADPFTARSHQRGVMALEASHASRDDAMRRTSPSRLGHLSRQPDPASVSIAAVPALSPIATPSRDAHFPDPEGVPEVGVDDSGDAWMLSAGRLRPTGDDTTVKLTMLCLQTFFQCLFTFMWLPMDALPWYGGSSSVSEAWTNFAKGVDCLLHCPNNLLYGALYSTGFVFVYIGAAYLNQYSVTLCAMVSQLSGPVTALLLIAFPVLNVTGDAAPWYVSLAAVCLLIAGTFVYVVWDEKTAAEKEAGELELKMEMHGLSNLAARHDEYVAVETEDHS